MRDGGLIGCGQAAKSPQQALLLRAQTALEDRRTRTAQHIQGIDATRCHRSQVIGLGRSLATLVLALGIGLDPTNVTEHPLGQPQTFPFFP
ncbi:hypothetical protein D3C84_1134400 [compost metagenome]